MNNRILIFMLLSMISGMVISRPDNIMIKLGRNVQSNLRLKLQWLNRVDEGQYVLSQPLFINKGFKIIVPRQFRGLNNSGTVSTDGFMLTANSDDQKSAHILFPYDDRKNLSYEFSLVARIEEAYSE